MLVVDAIELVAAEDRAAVAVLDAEGLVALVSPVTGGPGRITAEMRYERDD